MFIAIMSGLINGKLQFRVLCGFHISLYEANVILSKWSIIRKRKILQVFCNFVHVF